MALDAKLVMVNVPAAKTRAAAQFYATLLGIDFIPAWSNEVEGYHAPISGDGIKLAVQEPGPGQKGVSCIFAVADLAVAARVVEQHGGRIVGKEFSLPIAPPAMDEYRQSIRLAGLDESLASETLGRALIVKDPADNSLVLVQLEKHAEYSFKFGPYATGLSARQVEEHKREHDVSSRVALAKAGKPVKAG